MFKTITKKSVKVLQKIINKLINNKKVISADSYATLSSHKFVMDFGVCPLKVAQARGGPYLN